MCNYEAGGFMSTRALVVLILLALNVCAQADDLGERVRYCSAIENDDLRLACFDGLTGLDAPSAPQVVAEVAAPPPAPENLGAERLRHKERAVEAEEEINVTATVTRCSEGGNDRYVFYFDNGQVWKQSNNDRVRFRDCNFDVTITKDFFGYKMQQEGETRRIRIKRVK